MFAKETMTPAEVKLTSKLERVLLMGMLYNIIKKQFGVIKRVLVRSAMIMVLLAIARGRGVVADESMYSEIARGLDIAMLQYADAIWPGCSWGGLPVLLTDEKTQTAYCWKLPVAETGQANLTKIEYGSLPDALIGKNWSSGRYDGHKVLSLDIGLNGYDLDKIYPLLCHEGFHIIGQSNWRIATSSQRGDSYPQDWYARFLRHQMAYCLYVALNNHDYQQVRQAVYWQNCYAILYPDEVAQNNGYDRLESSAEYVGIKGAAVAFCGSIDETLLLPVELRLINEFWQEKYNNFAYSGSAREGESYYIGMLAGMCMDVYGIEGWKDAVTQGKTAMEILAAHTAPEEGVFDHQLLNQTYAYYQQQNKLLGAIVDKFESDNTNNTVYALALPADSMQGVFVRQGVLNYLSNGSPVMLINGITAKFVVNGHSVELCNSIATVAPLADNNGNMAGYFIVHVTGDYDRVHNRFCSTGVVVCNNLPVRLVNSTFSVSTLVAD